MTLIEFSLLATLSVSKLSPIYQNKLTVWPEMHVRQYVYGQFYLSQKVSFRTNPTKLLTWNPRSVLSTTEFGYDDGTYNVAIAHRCDNGISRGRIDSETFEYIFFKYRIEYVRINRSNH